MVMKTEKRLFMRYRLTPIWRLYFHPTKFDSFKDEKMSKTVSVAQSKNLLEWKPASLTNRVSVQGVKSLGDHFACLCRGFEVKKNLLFFFPKENGNTFTLLIIFIASLPMFKASQFFYEQIIDVELELSVGI